MYQFFKVMEDDKSFMEVFTIKEEVGYSYLEHKLVANHSKFKIKYTIGEFTEVSLETTLTKPGSIKLFFDLIILSKGNVPKEVSDLVDGSLLKENPLCTFFWKLKEDVLPLIDTNHFPFKDFTNLSKVQIEDRKVFFDLNLYDFITFSFEN
jgi:hypothetical protein